MELLKLKEKPPLSRNIVIWGQTGTTKTSLAASSRRRKHSFEWDIDSMERAKTDRKLVELHQYLAPATVLEDFGFVDTSMVGQQGKGPVRIQHNMQGWVDVYWNGWIKDSMEFFKTAPKDEYAMVDTTAPVWEAAQNTIKERIQNDMRFKNMEPKALKTAEYETPNKEQEAYIHMARSTGHDLVWVGHAREIWDPSEGKYTGKFKLDGWKGLEKNADIVLETVLRGSRALAIVRKGPLGILNWEMEGMTLDDIFEFYDAAKALSDADWDLPAEGDYPARIAALLEMAEKVG